MTTIEGDLSMLEETMEASSVVISAYLLKRKAEFDPEDEEDVESDDDTMESMESMEASLLSKRKAEFDPEEEEESGEESGEGKSKIEGAEVKIDYLFEAPEWDVDSFDGLEYYSSSELSPSSDDDEVAIEHYRIAKRQLIESKGFYVDRELTPSLYFRRIHPVSSECGFGAGRTFRTYWEEMVHVCLQKHNKDKGSKVEFVELVRGNYRAPPRSKSYITFMAREKPDGPLVEYQAKCMVTYDAKRHPILCRPTPLPKH